MQNILQARPKPQEPPEPLTEWEQQQTRSIEDDVERVVAAVSADTSAQLSEHREFIMALLAEMITEIFKRNAEFVGKQMKLHDEAVQAELAVVRTQVERLRAECAFARAELERRRSAATEFDTTNNGFAVSKH